MKSLWSTFVLTCRSILVRLGIINLSFREKLPSSAKIEYDKIMELARFPFLQENISLSKIRHRLTHSWIVLLDNISPLLVSDFQPPSVVRSYDESQQQNVTTFSYLHISFYDVIGSSTLQQLRSLMNDNLFDLTIKIVDPNGATIETWKMKVRAIGIHSLTILDYANSEPIKWQLECECLQWDIQASETKDPKNEEQNSHCQ